MPLLALAAQAAGPYPINMCVGTRNGNLGCSANDISIAEVRVTNGVTSCLAGTVVDIGIAVLLQSNAGSRYDIGVFLARDGKPASIPVAEGGSADCAVSGVPIGPAPLANLNGNVCGDIESSSQPALVDLGIVSVLCVPDQNGRLRLPATITWQQNASSTCQAPPAAWVEAGGPSKCNASSGIDIAVQVSGSLTIVKQTLPAATAGSFAFTATGATPAAFNLSHGQQRVLTTGLLSTTPTTVTVTEALLAGFDPTADIACTTADGGPASFVSIDRANRSITASFTAADSRATCTFTNKAQSRIRVVKATTGGDGAFPFVGAQQDFTIVTAAGTGEQLLSGLSAGIHSVTEIVPAGWTLSNISCVDPSGGTTVNVPGKSASVDLAIGETVTCTFTNTKPPATGVINIVKSTTGGDGVFPFTTNIGGAQAFTLRTSGGTSPAKSFTGVAAGTYAVTELVPPGWTAPTISCADPTGNSSGAGATATVDLAASETVTCTFANRANASVTVRKLVSGGDGTFNFSGTASFSIATSAGVGTDATTFASVTPGSAITIAETPDPAYSFAGATCLDDATGAVVGTPVPNGRVFTPSAGQKVTCTFSNTKLAQLTIVELSSPKSPQVFSYATTGTGLASFTLFDDGSGGNTRVFANLAPGQAYTVSQSAAAGWATPLIACSDRNATAPGDRTPVDVAGRSVSPSLQPGESLTCIFINQQLTPGSIGVVKTTRGGDDTFAFANSGGVGGSPTNPAAFTIATASGSGSRQLTSLSAGTYTITETLPAGWLSPPTVQCAVLSGSNTTFLPANNGVTVNLGTTGFTVDSVACGFDNTRSARITIVEDAIPDAAQAFAYTAQGAGMPASFSLTNDGTAPPADRRAFAGLALGTYRFAASTPAGWRLVSINCAGNAGSVVDLPTGSATVTAGAGDDVTCTFRHARESTITVIKSAPGATASDVFTFQGPPGLAGDYAAGQSRTATVLPGAYTVSEIVPGSWTLANIACTGGTVTYTGATAGATNGFEAGDNSANILVAAGNAVVCTFTNAPAGSVIVVRKDSVGGSGVFAFTGVQDFQIDTRLRIIPEQEIFVAAGTHTVREIVPAGWRLTGLGCTGNSAVDLATATATITIGAGERVRCVFTDEKLGRIQITKAIRGELAGTFDFAVPPALDPAQRFSLSPTPATGSATRTFENVAAGTYVVSELAPPAGFRLLSIACTDPTGNTTTNSATASATIDVAPGETVACTYTNATTATLVVAAVSYSGVGRFTFLVQGGLARALETITIDTATFNAEIGFGREIRTDLQPTVYTITAQAAPPGWSFRSNQCVSSSGEQHWTITGNTTTINLPDGENIRCYYFYAPAPAAGGEVAVPTLTPASIALLAFLLAASGWYLRRGGRRK